ncbi:MAG TPA: hypothetical protein VGT24_03125 [Candidatus Acidoferrales bacterium]|nr:hypothetical protein [Candidatus Acidoferrales bacterium]
MKQNAVYCPVVVSLFLLTFGSSAVAQERRETIIPAGTMLHCTLDEPNFSSKTADVGDPVICRLANLILFNHSVFPRGAYLAGHLEADKEPGHFVGKGYLKIEFDRIGLPDGVLAVPAKVIAARGFHVNRKGQIVGHGHPERDAVEWMLPPLWPEKVVTLPARGPRPTLKAEELLTLRLMDDVAIPEDVPQSNLRSSGKPASHDQLRSNRAFPALYFPARPLGPPTQQTMADPPQLPVRSDAGTSPKPTVEKADLNLIVLRNGSAYAVRNLRADGNRLTYLLSNGATSAVELSEVDWNKTFQANAESGSTLTLQGEGAH